MNRKVALALGVVAAVAAGLALGPVVRAGEKAADKSDKKVERRVVIGQGAGSFLGVGLAEVEGEGRGALVKRVEADSPAAKAGIKEGDVVVRFDGEAVRSASHLARLVGETPAGRSVGIDVTRGGSTEHLKATVAEGNRKMRVFEGGDFPGMKAFRFELPEPPEPPEPPEGPEALEGPETPGVPEAPPAPRAPRAPRPPMALRWFNEDAGDLALGLGGRRLGIEFIDMGEQLAAAYKLASKGAVLVTSVDAGSPAAKAGVKAGDVVLKFDGRAIEDGGDLRDAVQRAADEKPVPVSVQRDGRTVDLTVTLAKRDHLMKRRSRSGVTM